VRGLRVDAVHGVLDTERHRPQPFEIDLDLYVDATRAARTDALDDTADYDAAVEAAMTVMRGPSRALLESLAAAVGDAVLGDGRVDAVTVVVRKLRPPLLHPVSSTAARVTRRRAPAPNDGAGADDHSGSP